MVEPRRLTFEQAVDATLVTDVQIAPDGQRVAYVTTSASRDGDHPTSAIWIAPAEGGESRRLATAEAEHGSPRWSPDGRWLAFLSDRGTRGVQQLWLLALDGGEPRPLTDRNAGVRHFAWSPAGTTIAFTSTDDESEEERQRREERGNARVLSEDGRRAGLWTVAILDEPVSGPRVLPVPRRVSPVGMHVGGYIDAGFSWAPGGDRFVVMAGRSPRTNDRIRSEMFLLDLDGQTTSLGEFEGVTTSPRFSRDGEILAFIGAADVIPSRWTLLTMPAAGGEVRVVAPDLDGSFHDFAWLPDGRIVALVETHQRHGFAIVDPTTGDHTPAWDPPATPGSTSASLSASSDGQRYAFVWTDATSPGDVCAGQIGAGQRVLTDLNPWTREVDLGEMREIRWPSTDGTQIEGLLILPVGYEGGRRYPLLTNIHGGPAAAWTWNPSIDCHDCGQFMAQRGFAVCMPNPRGSTGRGIAFQRAIAGGYGELDLEDVLSGVDWLVAQGIADPERLVIGGWSGGGYLTNLAIVTTDRFKAAVSGAGTSNWISDLGTSDIRAVFSRYVGEIEDDPATAWRLSPIRQVRNATTPTLILFGEGDERVPPNQGYELYEGLRSRGVEVEMVVYPGEGHGISQRRHQLDVLRRVVAWYERFAG
jgi:dipeptidyl aminopeptidase/acylaminoacyl peptidase